MNKQRITSYSIIIIMIFGALYMYSLINTANFNYNDEENSVQNSHLISSSDDSVPAEYYQELDLNGTYVYNVTQFGDVPAWWTWFAGFRGMWKTDPGGKIIINY